MRISPLVFLLAIIVTTTPFCELASANTWRVEQDGSGDFTNIQSAVDASAPGDTILIGPGNYNQLHEIQIPNWGPPTRVVVSVDVEGLVFIGAGRDQVFIGPDVFDPADMGMMTGPMGFFGGFLEEPWLAEGITFQNMYDGVYSYGHFSSRDCKYINLKAAGIVIWFIGMVVENCLFENNGDSGLQAYGPGTGFSIVNCEFQNSKLYFQNCQDISISSCLHFGDYSSGGLSGVAFDTSSGIVRSCIGSGFGSQSLNVIGQSEMQVLDCNFQSFGSGVTASGGGLLEVENSIISGGLNAAFSLRSRARATVTGSHILKTNGEFVRCYYYPESTISLDFTNNFWGTTDLDTIAAYIWDGNDDSELGVIINYDPISDVPLPVEGQEKSFGSFKAMFR